MDSVCGFPPRSELAGNQEMILWAVERQNLNPVSPVWQPKVNPWLIASAVMLATFMEVLDTSVANVSLAHIAGNLAVSYDEATWVLTGYLVANAVVLPITGWLGRYFGRKRFLLTCIGIFTIASALCGLATSLPMLVIARILQGTGGGALQPTAQAVLLESFPPEKRGLSMSFYAMGVVVAPILGPTLGGWLTGRLLLAMGILYQFANWDPCHHFVSHLPGRSAISAALALR
jgi:MFS transporter, DHA2 family, multidrug resistance protein